MGITKTHLVETESAKVYAPVSVSMPRMGVKKGLSKGIEFQNGTKVHYAQLN